MKIHHATAKKAKANGLVIAGPWENGDFQVSSLAGGNVLATAKDPKDALDLALLEIKPVKLRPSKAKSAAKPKRRKARKQADDDDGEEGDEPEVKSVVKPKYKTKYRPHKMTCGDALAQQVRAEFMSKDDPDTGKKRLDWPRFKAFARNNGCWSDSYAGINHGLARMSVVNRLRKLIRNKVAIKWGA